MNKILLSFQIMFLFGNIYAHQSEAISLQLDIGEVSRYSKIYLFYSSNDMNLLYSIDKMNGSISKTNSGPVQNQEYIIICNNKKVISYIYYTVSDKKILIKRNICDFAEYIKLWNNIYKQKGFELKSLPFIDDVISSEELEKNYKTIGMIKTTHEFNLEINKKTNKFKIQNIYDVIDPRYNKILKEIMSFLKIF